MPGKGSRTGRGGSDANGLDTAGGSYITAPATAPGQLKEESVGRKERQETMAHLDAISAYLYLQGFKAEADIIDNLILDIQAGKRSWGDE